MSDAPKTVCWACHYAGYTCTKHPAEPAPDVIALRAALDEAEAEIARLNDHIEGVALDTHKVTVGLVKERDAANALLRDGLLTVQTGRNEPLVIWSETVAAHLGAKP